MQRPTAIRANFDLSDRKWLGHGGIEAQNSSIGVHIEVVLHRHLAVHCLYCKDVTTWRKNAWGRVKVHIGIFRELEHICNFASDLVIRTNLAKFCLWT